jgi:hypothetical protein
VDAICDSVAAEATVPFFDTGHCSDSLMPTLLKRRVHAARHR